MLSNRLFCVILTICALFALTGCQQETPILSEFSDGVYVSDYWEVLIRDGNTVKYGSLDTGYDVPTSVDEKMPSETFTGEIVVVGIYKDYTVLYIKCSSHTPYTLSCIDETQVLTAEAHSETQCFVPLTIQATEGGVKFSQFYAAEGSGVFTDGSTCSAAITCFENLELAIENVKIMQEPWFSTGVRQ